MFNHRDNFILSLAPIKGVHNIQWKYSLLFKDQTLWDITACWLVNIYRRFGGEQILHLKCRRLNMKDQSTTLFWKIRQIFFNLRKLNISEVLNLIRHRCEKLKSRVASRSHLYFRCGFCTTSKVRTTHTPLNRKTCSTGLQRTVRTATSRHRTFGGCTMTNASSRTTNWITTMRQTRRRRRVAVLPYCCWIIR